MASSAVARAARLAAILAALASPAPAQAPGAVFLAEIASLPAWTPEDLEPQPTAVEEVEAWATVIRAWAEGYGEFDEPVSYPAISARWALFESRFGIPPQQVDGWSAVVAAAAPALERLESWPRPVPSLAFDDGWQAPWMQCWRGLLLEILGYDEDARRLFFVESKHGCCARDSSHDDLLYRRLQGEWSLRHGDPVRASHALLDAFLDRSVGWWSYEAPPLLELSLAAALEAAGDDEAAVLLFEDALARPSVAGSHALAEEALARRGVPGPVAKAVVETPFFWNEHMYGSYRARMAALVVGREGDPSSLRLLALRIAGPDEHESVLTPQSGFDAGAAVLVEHIQCAPWHLRASAVLALEALDRTGTPQLRRHLELLADDLRLGGWYGDAWGAAWIDRTSRLLLGDGPSLPQPLPDSLAVTEAWLEWLGR